MKKSLARIGRQLVDLGNALVLSSRNNRSSPYPLCVSKRQLPSEPCGGFEQFDSPEALQINKARINHLDSLNLPLRGKRILDAGCGVGHFADQLTQRGCEVVAFDGRPENIGELNRRFPAVRAYVLDIERDSLSHLGQFDAVFCYGFIYHLENPLLALRKLSACCNGIFLIEANVCDHNLPLTQMADEYFSANQALNGLGNRPSPAYIVTALDRIGFEWVYVPRTLPDHPDFKFKWKNNLDYQRNGRNLRAVFIASRSPLNDNPQLLRVPWGK